MTQPALLFIDELYSSQTKPSVRSTSSPDLTLSIVLISRNELLLHSTISLKVYLGVDLYCTIFLVLRSLSFIRPSTMPSALVQLLREGTLEQVKSYVKQNPESVKEKDEETGRIALHDAVDASINDEDELVGVVELEKVMILLETYPMGVTEERQARPTATACSSRVRT